MANKSTTLSEVALAANVSPMTASRAINNRSGVSRETREHVLKIAADLGYVVNRAAQKLSGGKSHIIGVIATDPGNQYTASLIAGISDAAWASSSTRIICKWKPPTAKARTRPAPSKWSSSRMPSSPPAAAW